MAKNWKQSGWPSRLGTPRKTTRSLRLMEDYKQPLASILQYVATSIHNSQKVGATQMSIADGSMDKRWYIHTMNYCLAVKGGKY